MNHVLLGRGIWWRWTEMAGAGWEGGAWSAMDMRLNGWPWGRERQSINAGVELRNIVDGSMLPGRESVADIERARVAEIKDFPTSHLLCLLVPASFGAGGSSRCLRQPRTRTRKLPPFLRTRTLPSFSINN
ncbi:hypothetical protein D6D12_07554 [Aureobasidium pullulans]|uniref:Uncharacterized protein n=1 Tax=Aureobasidium pullulans TaxID=5580 RepID=A0AB74JLA7_AURPU|nr:hypothetical protein D6D12_07554 [Aureobasidium pullulans]THX54265.1 hypothetical protein D6D11_04208 [Aureobasidium pullulans]